MIEYSWLINALEYAPELDGLPKVIVNVNWTYIGKKDDVVQSVYGSQPVGKPNEEDFIPFEDITEDEVIGWLESELDVPALQLTLAQQIENIINPKVIVDNNPFNK